MIDCYCERECEFFEDRSTNYIIEGYCHKYGCPVALDFYDWWMKCDECFDERVFESELSEKEREVRDDRQG